MTNLELAEKIDAYIRNNYPKDHKDREALRKRNGLVCLFKINIDNLTNIHDVSDFDVHFNQAKGHEEELLNIINICKDDNYEMKM